MMTSSMSAPAGVLLTMRSVSDLLTLDRSRRSWEAGSQIQPDLLFQAQAHGFDPFFHPIHGFVRQAGQFFDRQPMLMVGIQAKGKVLFIEGVENGIGTHAELVGAT